MGPQAGNERRVVRTRTTCGMANGSRGTGVMYRLCGVGKRSFRCGHDRVERSWIGNDGAIDQWGEVMELSREMIDAVDAGAVDCVAAGERGNIVWTGTATAG